MNKREKQFFAQLVIGAIVAAIFLVVLWLKGVLK